MNVQFSTRDLDANVDLLVIGVGDDLDGDLDELDTRFGGKLRDWCEQRKFTGSAGSKLAIPSLGRIAAAELLLVGTGDGSASSLFAAAGQAGRTARSRGAATVQLDLGGQHFESVFQGYAAGNYHYDRYKPEAERTRATESLTLTGTGTDVGRATTLARYVSWTRDLVNGPPADIYPDSLAHEAGKLAKLDHTTVTVWGADELRKNNCVGIIAVGQGSSRDPRLIHVSYRPPGAKAHICLVGKGITFDAGGLSIKPTGGMLTMKCDMGGAATMLGVVGAVADIGAPVAVDCFIGSAENMLGADAYKLMDVLTYDNGVTVEIHNTDAEGRLVLADALIQASRVEGATHIIDAATLTGACAIATGPDFAGLFTPDDALADDLMRHASANGDGLFRLPYHEPYKSMLKSDVAQIKNVGGREGGATTAALFLSHFVGEGKRWAHLDIAGNSFMDKPHGIYPSGGTGENVRGLVSWIEELGQTS